MGGETEERPSGWTVDTLLSHITTLLNEKDMRYDQRFEAQQLALRDALLSQEKAVTAALAAAQTAVQKAEMAAEKRFDAVNEFRAQLADQAAGFMPRAESSVLFGALKEQIDHERSATYERLNQLTNTDRFSAGRQVGSEAVTKFLFAAIGAIGVLAAILALAIR